MPEIRIDPLSGHRTIIAGERSKRPGGARPARRQSRSTPSATRSPRATRTAPRRSCTRCVPAVGRRTRPGWTVRVVPNLYPALTAADPDDAAGDGAGQAEIAAEPARGKPELFTALPATGAHEVIVNGPQPVLSLADLPAEQVAAAVGVWRERMRAHAGCAYTQLIVNERREGERRCRTRTRSCTR